MFNNVKGYAPNFISLGPLESKDLLLNAFKAINKSQGVEGVLTPIGGQAPDYQKIAFTGAYDANSDMGFITYQPKYVQEGPGDIQFSVLFVNNKLFLRAINTLVDNTAFAFFGSIRFIVLPQF